MVKLEKRQEVFGMKRLVAFVLVIALAVFFTSCVGPTGATGPQGEQGIQGIRGEQGEQGIQGEKGDKGDKGDQGEQGLRGEKGSAGKSAYELYCETYGFEGTEEEWLSFLHQRLSEYTSADIYALAAKATVTIRNYNKSGTHVGSGTGFFIDGEGTLATAYHVIDGAHSIDVVMLNNEIKEVSRVIAFDAVRDIALIKVECDGATDYLQLEENGITPGETAYSFGSSLGFLDGSFASGVVSSGLRETVIDEDTDESFYELQYTAAVSSGNSGGPILNSHGKVIGVVTWKYTIGDGLNFATYIEELSSLDRTYDRSVESFFEDTEYFQIKMLEQLYEESESNDTRSSANIFASGYTVRGITTDGDYDYYKITVSGSESVDLTLAYCADEDWIYYPLLLDGSLNPIELQWLEEENVTDTVYCADIVLNPGTYYVRVRGYYTDDETPYLFYAYWRPVSELESFAYGVHYSDMFA